MTEYAITGRVVRATDLAPLANVKVRLITQAGYLANAENRQLMPAGQIDWTRSITGFSGTRWDYWQKYINNQMPLSWADFRDNALIYNPHLSDDGRVYYAEKSYLAPEISPATEVTWTAKLKNFAGSRWDCWEEYVKDKVPITWEQFRDLAMLYNLQLSPDQRLYKANKTYLIPEVTPTGRAYVEVTTDAQGYYQFEHIGAGAGGILEVAPSGYTPTRVPVIVNANINEPIQVRGGASAVRSALPNYNALHSKVRTMIDQALSMLGDERSVYDALPPQLQQMCYGSQFGNDPNHPYYKDIVCADLVSIALVAAGFNIDWNSGANPHMAQHYAPGPATLQEISDPADWQPGDVLVYGNNGAIKAGHVNFYVGTFQGTDRSGKSYPLSANYDVIEASMNFDLPTGQRWGLGNIALTHQQCLQQKRGFDWVKRVRLKAVDALV